MSFWIYHPFHSAIGISLLTWLIANLFLLRGDNLAPKTETEKYRKSSILNATHLSGQFSSNSLLYIGSLSIGFLFAFLLTNSLTISTPFAIISCGIPILILESREKRKGAKIQALWPEILDHIISGLNSGLSLAETLSELSRRGPKSVREEFALFERNLRNNQSLKSALKILQANFDESTADQVCTVLLMATSSGSSETTLTLRVLSDFLRSDIATREEISAKHGWVRNSAAIAAVAPWLLLLILASQPNTIAAYSTIMGSLVLLTGLVLSIIAYIWMRIVGKVDQAPRVFKI